MAYVQINPHALGPTDGRQLASDVRAACAPMSRAAPRWPPTYTSPIVLNERDGEVVEVGSVPAGCLDGGCGCSSGGCSGCGPGCGCEPCSQVGGLGLFDQISELGHTAKIVGMVLAAAIGGYAAGYIFREVRSNPRRRRRRRRRRR